MHVVRLMAYFQLFLWFSQMPVKMLYMVVEMAAQGEQGGEAEAIYSGRQKIKINHFLNCLKDVVQYQDKDLVGY